MKFNSSQTASLLLLTSLSACMPWNQPKQAEVKPVHMQIQQVNTLDTTHPSASPNVSRSRSIQIIAQVNEDDLLSQEFLYGADLQYSSSYDERMDLYNQSMAIGHIPAHFRIVDDELQLVADNRMKFPSDVNHPEQLLSRFKILSRTQEEGKPAVLTISGANSGRTLGRLFTSSAEGSSSEVQPSDLWIRSFEFIPDGNYILQQTSIALPDGTVAEFMESIFPSKSLTPGKDFKKFQMDPNDLVGADSGPVARYRFLAGDPVFEKEEELAYAQHFDLSPKADGSPGTIDFYVTHNIPDEFIEPVKNGVEGWNRYFLAFKGIERPVVRFMGKLPEGIHLGDPRYNVIAWDNRKVAGAAYESQAADPRTGKQSHSLIYLPAAWVSIGEEYWKGGRFSDPSSTKAKTARKKNKSTYTFTKIGRCKKDFTDFQDLTRSGRLSSEEIKTFGIQTLAQTLFHEVGHALGLAHNFKGSLSLDRSNPSSPFSHSIMDYNDYEIERGVFHSIQTSDGPLLEYDRQILSTIYNQGADVKSSDPVLPACADAEADSEVSGVDPLCNRYDIESDPTHSIQTAFKRITEANLPNDVTLADALKRLGDYFSSAEKIQSLKTPDQLEEYTADLLDSLMSSIRFYFSSGKASYTRTLMTNMKSLLKFKADILPSGYDETTLRMQTMEGLLRFAKMRTLPPLIDQTLTQIATQITQSLGSAPVFRETSKDAQRRMISQLKVLVAKVGVFYAKDPVRGIPMARANVFKSLKRHERVPFYLGNLGSGSTDFEMIIAKLLSALTTDITEDKLPRIMAASSLSSFKSRELPDITKTLEDTLFELKKQRDSAQSNEDRELVLTLLGKLDNKSSLVINLLHK